MGIHPAAQDMGPYSRLGKAVFNTCLSFCLSLSLFYVANYVPSYSPPRTIITDFKVGVIPSCNAQPTKIPYRIIVEPINDVF